MDTPTFIEIYPNALSDDFCDLTIDLIDNICLKNQSNNAGIGIVDQEGRKDISIFANKFDSLKPVVKTIENTLEKYWTEYAKKYEMFDSRPFLSSFDNVVKLQKASAGGGFTAWHSEHGSSETAKGRFAVWMFYLNDVNKGGTTDFKYYNLSVRPRKGTLVLWPASFTHSHRGSPDLGEDKYIATGWFTLSLEQTKKAKQNK